MTEATPRRRRWPWILAAVLLALPVAGLLVLRAFVNAEAIRPRLVAAVQDATGRTLSVGDIGLALSLRPTLALTDVALANMEGGSRPQMLTARRVEVQVAILPLLSRRVEIARILLDQPDLLLETAADGRANWQFRPAPPAAAPAPASPAEPSAPLQIALDDLRLEGARVTWRDGRAGTAETVEIPRLEASAPLAGPTTARGRMRLRGQEVGLAATTGPVASLGGTASWPFDLRLTPAGGEMRAAGNLAGAAWTATVAARLPDLARLAPLLPDIPLPPLRAVEAGARLAGTGGELTGAEAIALRVGESDLSVLRPGLRLGRLEVMAPRLDAPLTLAAEAAVAGTPLRAAGTVGTPALLLGRARGALPVDFRLTAAGAEATIRGQVRDVQALAGVDLALALSVPDLAALAPLAGAPLPAIRDLRAEARLAERMPGLRGGAQLRALAVMSPPAEARGEVTLVAGERPGIIGRLDVARLDLDAIRAAMPAAAPAPAQPAAPAAPRHGRAIPDIALPVGALRGVDADLRLAIARLTAGGAEWRDIQAPIRLSAGQGGIAPAAVTTPGGPVTGEVAVNAATATPTLRVALRAPSLQLAPLQQALGGTVYLTGRAELDADLRGAGAGLRQVAASLGGHLGLAMLDATVEPALLGPVQQALRARVPVLPALPQRLPVECVALRADVAEGIARIGTLLVDAPAAKVAGSGTVNLGTEAIALRLLHDVRAAGTSTRVAAELGGTLAAPAYGGVNLLGAAVGVAGAIGDRVGGTVGQALAGLAQQQQARQEPLPDCGPALTAARGGQEGPMPARAQPQPQPQPEAAAPAAPARPQQPAAPAIPGPAGDLLRGLLRR